MSESASPSAAIWTPPPSIETLYAATAGNQFASINRPTAGSREEKEVPTGSAPIQYYSLATPNGNKVSICLEELGLDYDAHFINIGKGEQFNSGFVKINPNSKIPCLVDNDGPDGQPISLFESASICLYLCEKSDKFIFSDIRLKAEMMNWIFWQMSGQGAMTGNFGHFFVYAPDDKIETRDYGVARYGMEVQRLCDVLDKHLEGRSYIVGETYSLADIMNFPWFHQLRVGYPHKSGIKAAEFLDVAKYKNLNRWADEIIARPAVQRGITVCGWATPENTKPWLKKD